MANCSEIRKNMSSYIDNMLNEKDRSKLEEHVEKCPSCKAELDDIRHLVKLCREIEAEELPEDFNEKLHKKLIEEKKTLAGEKTEHSNKFKYIRIVSTVAACLLMTLVLKGVLDMTGNLTRTDSKSAEMSSRAQDGNNGSKSKAENSIAGTKAFDTAANAQTTENSFKIADSKSAAGSSAKVQPVAPDTMTAAADINTDKNEATASQPEASAKASSQATMQRSLVQNRNFSATGINAGITAASAANMLQTDQNKNVDIRVCIENKEAAAARVISTALKLGAIIISDSSSSPVSELFSGITAASYGNTEVLIRVKVYDDNYQQFINLLKTNFVPYNIEIGEIKNTDIRLRLDALERRYSELYRRIQQLQDMNTAAAEKELADKQKEKSSLESQIELLKKDVHYTFVNIYVELK